MSDFKYILLITLFLTYPELGFSQKKLVSVNFDFDKYELSQLEKEKLLEATNYVLDRDAQTLLKAYTDEIGSSTYNLKLSKKRAQSIKQILINELGLASENIEALGMGEDKALIPNRKKRRVDLFIKTIEKKIGEEDFGPSDQDLQKISPEESLEKTSGSENETAHLESQSSVQNEPKLKENKLNESNRYYLGLVVYENVLDAEDNNGPGLGRDAEWVSILNYQLVAAYQFNFKKYFWFGLEGEFHIQRYKIELDKPYVWDEKNPNLLGLSLRTDYERDRLGLGLDLRYKNEAFIFENNNDVSLEKSFLLSVQARGQYKFYESRAYSSRTGLILERSLIGEGFLDPRQNFGASLYVDLSKRNWFKDHELNFRLYYGIRDFVNKENDQREEVGGLQIRYQNKRWL